MSSPEKNFPFTSSHIREFKKELIKAGGFIPLMVQKEAIKRCDWINYISIYKDIEEYKTKYLTGAYKSLRSLYDTEMPYIFWNTFYEIAIEN